MDSLLKYINSPADIRQFSNRELEVLAEEIREVVIKQVSEKGGHLASNLGAVELTLALHCVFDTPNDKLIWDVGHQAYPHKLITGRYSRFHTLKQYGGLSGFLSRSESEYDSFISGHASTSLAAALGFAVARTRQKRNNHVIAVIGDGSITGGIAYEALNNAGSSNEDIIFILNDNKMSIAPNVGAVSKYLNRIIVNPAFNKLKEDVWELTGKLPNKGVGIRKIVSKLDDALKNFMLPGGFFVELGIKYFGPINGHNIPEMKEIFEQIKGITGPRLVHVLTEKGHGWDRAEKDAYHWHASAPFNVESGEKKSQSSSVSMAYVTGTTITELAAKHDDIIAITAAMPDGTGLEHFQKVYPDRFFDVGIAEQHAVTFAGGLACEGMKPFVAIYSTFMQRAVDQLIHDIALQNLNVVLVMSHGGLVGEDGATHHGAMDLTFLRMIPNIVIMVPSDENELRNMLFTACEYGQGPVAIRYSKGNALAEYYPSPFKKIEIGVSCIINQGEELLILCAGHMLQNAREALVLLNQKGFNPTLVDSRFVKPLNTEQYKSLISAHSCVLTIEDNVINGGFGSGISELMAKLDLFHIPVKHVGLPDSFVTHGNRDTLYAALAMDKEGIASQAESLIQFTRTTSLLAPRTII